ncbi:hypothetical protein HYN56_00545 [Flavobacterium crocinum]|uniref:Uncharacterized protein n=1 Tax=Flavobacterium crocinum TaxID=2183896 RepID=A0A2S1YFH3_9FLAO|nr:hypothetical protein HYN56_00545 [Flavobacterium crocinum]
MISIVTDVSIAIFCLGLGIKGEFGIQNTLERKFFIIFQSQKYFKYKGNHLIFNIKLFFEVVNHKMLFQTLLFLDFLSELGLKFDCHAIKKSNFIL